MQWLIRNQWPFWLGGVFVGLAEIIFYYHYDMFIVVTTGLAQMFAVTESKVFGVDWVGRVYQPGVYWFILAAVLGARLVVMGERESRGWVKYDGRMLALAFIGGFLFSFGTRIAAGCTTHHFMGGIPSMSIASWVVLLTGVPFAFLAFKISTSLGLGGYFRHQETRAIAEQNEDDPNNKNPGFNRLYNHWKSPLRWLLNLLLLTSLLLPLYFGLKGGIAGSVDQIGWGEVAWVVVPGLLLGIGIAKTGFGTECSVMAPESVFTGKDFYRRNGVPDCTYNMFRSMLPLQGFMVAIVMLNLFILGSWLTDTGTIPNAAGEQGLYWGHILGGPLLGMGAVFMIGCEVRTYARLGLGYSTALAALPGFYFGYLPYTLNKEKIDSIVFSEGLTDYITLPEFASATFGWSEQGWAIIYSLFLLSILIFSFATARRFLNISFKKLFVSNTDELVYMKNK